MAKDTDQLKIFLSYSRYDTAVADEIDEFFEAIGLRFLRDIRDIQYKDSIKEFMDKVREADHAIMLISDHFLKSEYCMYEILELFKEKAFDEKMLQVILPDADVFTGEGRLHYIRYWQDKKEALEQKAEGLPLQYLAKEAENIAHYENICGNIGNILTHLKDHHSIKYDDLRAENYATIISHLGIKEDDVKEQILKIRSITDEAEREFELEMLLTKYPDNADVFFALGLLTKNRKKCILYNSKAIALRPGFAMAYYNRGIDKRKEGDLDGAFEDYCNAIEIDPNDAMAYNNRGYVKNGLGDQLSAMEDFTKAIEIDPNYAVAYYNRGSTKGKIGDLDGAIEDHSKAIEIDPKYAEAYYNRGLAKRKAGNVQGAIEDYSKAIEIDPNDDMAYNNRGYAKSQQKDYQGAITDFSKALQLNPNYAKANYNLGRVHQAVGDSEAAKTNFQKALELDPSLEIPEEFREGE